MPVSSFKVIVYSCIFMARDLFNLTQKGKC